MDHPHPGISGQNRAARRAAARKARRTTGAALTAGSAALAATAGLIATAAPAGAATIVVDNTNDSGGGSLRDALANADDGDVIDLTGLSGQITLASELVIEDLVTITGPGAGALTISGNDAVRVFSVASTLTTSGTVTITGVTIADGSAPAGPGAGIFFDCDSAVESSLVLDGVVVTGNTGGELGGGLYFDRCDSGDLTITNSTISGNETTDGGGGIWFDDSDTLTIVNTTVSGNTAGDSGGGLYFDDGAGLTIRNSTFSGNTAAAAYGGGAIHTDSSQIPTTATIANSTFTENQAGYGGAIAVFYGDLALLQTTISGNTATGSFDGYDRPADGLYLGGTAAGGAGTRAASADPQSGEPRSGGGVGAQDVEDVTITGTIIAGNDDTDVATYFGFTAALTSDHSLFGAVTDNITVTDAGGTQQGVDDPGLDPLADNGGPTQTMALRADSLALNTGPDPVPDFPGNEFDQRGPDFLRVVFGRVDIGAYEVQAPPGPEPIVLVPTFTG